MSHRTIRQILFDTIPLEMVSIDSKIDDLLSEHTGHVALVEMVGIIKRGKLLRPGLLLLLYHGLNTDEIKSNFDKAINAAISIEALHIATLLHDDVIDSATMRRDMPTINSIYGNKMAILLGDMLIAKSLSIISQDKNIEIVNKICNTALTLTNGEMTQMKHLSDINMDITQYIEIISGKTACLFSTATEIGGLLAKVDQNTIECVKRFGHNLGLAFQIMDDVIDIWGNATGKVLCNDLREKKVTIVIIKCLELCNTLEKKIIQNWFLNHHVDTSEEESSINQIVTILNKYNVRSLCVDIAKKYINIGNTYLNSCTTGDYVFAIHSITNNILYQT